MRRAISSASAPDGERSAGHYPDGVFVEDGDLVAAQFDARLGCNGAGHFGGEGVAVHGEGVASGDARVRRGSQEQRIEAAQFIFEQPWGGGFGLALERVAADEFRQAIRLVRGRWLQRAHFVEHAIQAPARHLPGRFAARKATAYDVDVHRMDAISAAGTRRPT